MYAIIRRYQAASDRTEELARAVSETASSLGKLRGFVSCLVMEAEPCVLATIGIFENQQSLVEAHHLFDTSLAEQRGHLLSGDPQVTSGEVVFQRGL